MADLFWLFHDIVVIISIFLDPCWRTGPNEYKEVHQTHTEPVEVKHTCEITLPNVTSLSSLKNKKIVKELICGNVLYVYVFILCIWFGFILFQVTKPKTSRRLAVDLERHICYMYCVIFSLVPTTVLNLTCDVWREVQVVQQFNGLATISVIVSISRCYCSKGLTAT